MTVVMESDMFPIIGINPLLCDDRTAKISADIFGYSIAEIGFSINVETISIFAINEGLSFLKRKTEA